MKERPEEFLYATGYGLVVGVHPATWEVDVLSADGGEVRRAIVCGPRLPERSTEKRPQWVVYWHGGARHGQAWCYPVDSRLPGLRYDKDDLVYLSEVQAFRVTIRAPGNRGDVVQDKTGELEIRTDKGGRSLRLRIEEDGGVIRLNTPRTRLVLHDDEQSVTVEADGSVRVNAGADVVVVAGGAVEVTAGTDVVVRAAGTTSVIAANVAVVASANVSVVAGGNITATGGGIGTVQVAGPLLLKGAQVTIKGTTEEVVVS